MTDLDRIVSRRTSAAVHEKSKRRRIILSFIPPARIGVRLEGTRETFQLDAESIYAVAVARWVDRVGKRAKELMKNVGLRKASALAKARRELKKELTVK